ncbi:DUF6461 domain-containing protein [Streptomyces sp. N35]|uniref:DUF6461 domain-containing protein n=1 Tax=Streptomyces sp. N35 TaxID=2795730 RepID=UPI0018F31547|nr:DUF6461 domain-containing protein [Streptomyces sp. N35]
MERSELGWLIGYCQDTVGLVLCAGLEPEELLAALTGVAQPPLLYLTDEEADAAVADAETYSFDHVDLDEEALERHGFRRAGVETVMRAGRTTRPGWSFALQKFQPFVTPPPYTVTLLAAAPQAVEFGHTINWDELFVYAEHGRVLTALDPARAPERDSELPGRFPASGPAPGGGAAFLEYVAAALRLGISYDTLAGPLLSVAVPLARPVGD